MAIADMHGAGRWNDTFGWPRLAANDQIVAAQINLLERDQHQWKISLVMAASEGKRIDESRADLVPPDRFGDRLRIINMGENIGFWKESAKTLEYFFASPHRDQPIMDNSHPHSPYRSQGTQLELPARLCWTRGGNRNTINQSHGETD